MSEPREPIPGVESSDAAIDRATGDAPRDDGARVMTPEDRAAAALQAGLAPTARMPEALRLRLIAEGEAIVGAAGGAGGPRVAAGPGRSVGRGAWWALAACLALLGAGTAVGTWAVMSRTRQLESERARVAALEARVRDNEALLADARAAVAERDERLAQAEARQVETAEMLASATRDLDLARLAIARYETPVDPATLRQNRLKLLETPGTVRIAWAPFDLPNAPPAEQKQVLGDVVWNDELQSGYLRFEGLAVNDPNVEQYQVWIIDERGMEQKVSGGVFNATAQGEVIVPISPGIDVRRVALFAVTVEEPGGTWVPDLRRRVVVAPRGEAGG